MRLNTVEFLSSGEDRIYAKEQALIDLVRDELAAGRPCIVYLRQTATRDIQPRIARLIAEHVPGAKPYILKNSVQAERREKVIDAEVAKGCNVIICNPELTKTGLDLVFAATIIFAELVFNLSTLMQAAARSYRLNQTFSKCKVIYLYYENTMEQTAVYLMSRKQRAAKLLAGDVGLSGLDALTEGEGGFETALLEAITQDTTLVDPAALFRTSAGQGAIEAEDAAFWNVEIAGEDEPEPLQHDPLIRWAVEHLGAQPGLPVQWQPQTREATTPSIITLPAQRADKPAAPPRKSQPRRQRRDLLAVPEDVPTEPKLLPLIPKHQPDEPQPVQLAMF